MHDMMQASRQQGNRATLRVRRKTGDIGLAQSNTGNKYKSRQLGNMSEQNDQQQQKGFFGTAASGLGNTLGAATNTVGKGVQGVTDTAGNVVAAGGKGLGDAVTGITQGAGDTTKAAGNFVGDTTKAGGNSVSGGQNQGKQ
ncbi:ca2+-modulated nonselective cation channel polycystin [Stemphylium lycopersici]|uniref:Ca2+-modulated nonselective cation channel polycystin n=1 Tax=Stemphylium lycopersici TaxID=183478 RepID=A0A364MUW1_STELY|nr:hypothetical protein TW65_03517 [Stemphylium lycopersici]RAQ99292.1 ca2+-modulated nonselective cation channel polycystin [Stemphylium lycopersici]RAR04291.1 ca2+-modulated nonselective cation channel polycystin [Stemphylium lycopersici]